MMQDILIEKQDLASSTDAFWKKETKLSPISSSTADNYDEEEKLFFPQDCVPEEEKLSGFFILVGDSLYKVR